MRLAKAAIVAFSIVGPAVCPAHAQAKDRVQQRTIHQAVEEVIDDAIRPGFAAFADQADAMARSVNRLCASPDRAALDETRDAFGALVEAWGRVEFIRLGPLSQDNRLERILFWPDRRGRGLRQIQQVIATGDDTALDAATIAHKSVAVQGLVALEYSLFGTGSETLVSEPEARRCAYAQAIAGNVANIAHEASTAWQGDDGIAALWLDPAAENPLFRDESEQINGLVKMLGAAFEMIKVQRLDPVLRENRAAMRPRAALFWRSDNWGAALAANVAGLDALLDAADLPATVDAAAARQLRSMRFELRNAADMLSQTDTSVEAAAQNEADYRRMMVVRLIFSGLTTFAKTRLPETYDLSSGFSQFDGD